MTNGKAVIFGAGNVGRGFLGDVLSEAGKELVFVDVDDALIEILNDAGGYAHLTVSTEETTERIIAPVRAIRSDNPEALEAEVKDADIIATAVGARVLPLVCRPLAQALGARMAAGGRPVDILLAENLHNAPENTKAWLLEANPDLADHLDRNIGLVGTSIGRMIPAPREGLQPGAIEVEPYRFLPVDVAAMRAELPHAAAFVTDAGRDFHYYSDRKLFVHNMGHAMAAYLGDFYGDQFVWQAIARPEVWGPVRAAMTETAAALSQTYAAPLGPLIEHIDDLLYRFTNRALNDTTARVGGDPARKTSAEDRFQGAISMCRSAGIPCDHVLLGLAAGLRKLQTEVGLTDEEALRVATELTEGERDLLARLFQSLRGEYNWSDQQEILCRQYRGARVP